MSRVDGRVVKATTPGEMWFRLADETMTQPRTQGPGRLLAVVRGAQPPGPIVDGASHSGNSVSLTAAPILISRFQIMADGLRYRQFFNHICLAVTTSLAPRSVKLTFPSLPPIHHILLPFFAAFHPLRVLPPSISITLPVMWAEATLLRNRIRPAKSLGLPTRPVG